MRIQVCVILVMCSCSTKERSSSVIRKQMQRERL